MGHLLQRHGSSAAQESAANGTDGVNDDTAAITFRR